MSKNKFSALGRGLESLIPTDLSSDGKDILDQDIKVSKNSIGINIPVKSIKVNTQQPRSRFSPNAMRDLVSSIAEYGIMQPIVVLEHHKGEYELISGERRWRAAKSLGLETIPAIVREADEQSRLALALIENIQRENLSPIEVAEGYLNLKEVYGLSINQISKKVGKEVKTVHNTIRILNIPPEAKEALINKDITEGHARALAGLWEYPQKQEELLNKILKDGFSVRQAEQFVTLFKNELRLGTQAEADKIIELRNSAVNRINSKLGKKVIFRPRSKGGTIIIDYKDDSDLEEISKIFI